MYAYSNNGHSFRAVDPSYKPEADEVLFADYATPTELAVAFPQYISLALFQAQSSAKAQVDTGAEAARLRFITAGAGQAMAYEAKLAEAQAYQAAAKPVATDYPHLQAEVGATAADIAGVAATIVVKSAAWKQVSAAIEGLRLKTKAAIAAATDQAGVDAALTGLVWPSPG